MVNVKDFLEQALWEGFIICPKCSNRIEPDAEECICGWINPLREYGLI